MQIFLLNKWFTDTKFKAITTIISFSIIKHLTGEKLKKTQSKQVI